MNGRRKAVSGQHKAVSGQHKAVARALRTVLDPDRRVSGMVSVSV